MNRHLRGEIVKEKVTSEQLDKLKLYWRCAKEAEDRFTQNLFAIEATMEKDIGIESISFFHGTDGHICGIGNYPLSTMRLVQQEELEDDK